MERKRVGASPGKSSSSRSSVCRGRTSWRRERSILKARKLCAGAAERALSAHTRPSRPAAVRHAPAGVEHEERAEVGLHLEALDVVLVQLGEGAPVDVLDLVAGRVLLVLRELHRLAVVRALVQARQHPFHDLAGPDLERAEAGEKGGVEGHAFVSRSSSAITRRESTPSASAWKLVSTR